MRLPWGSGRSERKPDGPDLGDGPMMIDRKLIAKKMVL